MSETKELSAEEQIVAFMREHDIAIVSEFVPWSQSRNRDEKHRSLNWRVQVLKGERHILTTDYSAGIAHAPGYRQPMTNHLEIVEWETENGYPGRISFGGPSRTVVKANNKALCPKPTDVLVSLALASDALDRGGFEEWASDFGYDPDSRKAETIYRACLEIALKLRNGLGEDALAQLREACQDY